MGVHINSALQDSHTDIQGEISSATLKKFVAYCRERCAPRLNYEAAALLSGQYVHIRNSIRESLLNKPGESQVVPITVRQLEALVRMAEALAKMRLSAEATVADVEEALRLFKVSTLAASQSNPVIMGALGGLAPVEVQRAEEYLKRRIGMRESTGTKRLLEEGLSQGHGVDALKRGIMAMVMRNELQELNQGKTVRRIR
jgi:DNA replication licensing factor MCM5